MAAEIFTTAAVAAAVSAVIAYAARKLFEYKLNQQLESLKSDLTKQRIYVEKIAALQTENFTGLMSLVYRIRNTARDIERDLPSIEPDAYATLRDLALRLLGMLYDGRLLMHDDVFNSVHRYKDKVQNFIDSCDRIVAGGAKSSGQWVNSARVDYRSLDQLYTELTPRLQQELHITKAP